MKWIVISIIPLVVLLGCKTTEDALRESAKKPLTSAQIKELYSGHTAKGTSNSTGRSFEVTYKPDGTSVLNSGSFTDRGKWWVEGKDTYCSQWTTIRSGAKRCLRIYDLGDKYQSVDMDGYASSTFTMN